MSRLIACLSGCRSLQVNAGFCTAPHFRVLSNGAAPFSALLTHPHEAADDLADRLHQAFRQAC